MRIARTGESHKHEKEWGIRSDKFIGDQSVRACLPVATGAHVTKLHMHQKITLLFLRITITELTTSQKHNMVKKETESLGEFQRTQPDLSFRDTEVKGLVCGSRAAGEDLSVARFFLWRSAPYEYLLQILLISRPTPSRICREDNATCREASMRKLSFALMILAVDLLS
jgi:hypothetical protein